MLAQQEAPLGHPDTLAQPVKQLEWLDAALTHGPFL